MTKVELAFALSRPIDEPLLARIAAAHGVYGILRIHVEPGGELLRVEYDASRLRPAEVEAVLTRRGVPLKR
ncbi:MAG: hypothetical protein FJW37_11915 [Acidobacteria bacterium]|nr:hypothetical protein [Acidobacteriota bacterium]